MDEYEVRASEFVAMLEECIRRFGNLPVEVDDGPAYIDYKWKDRFIIKTGGKNDSNTIFTDSYARGN